MGVQSILWISNAIDVLFLFSFQIHSKKSFFISQLFSFSFKSYSKCCTHGGKAYLKIAQLKNALAKDVEMQYGGEWLGRDNCIFAVHANKIANKLAELDSIL